ncbi:MAG: hypothetical protein M1831_001642 [Alyxoria varia]|nr:MAG: hypothetical protein M1831_001642 [Alyxoria varia]
MVQITTQHQSRQDRKSKIAILSCDTPIDNVRQKYGGYGDMFKVLLSNGAEMIDSMGPGSTQEKFDFKVIDCLSTSRSDYPDPAQLDGILITGSRHNSFDNDQWILDLVDYVKHVVENHQLVKVIGVCFGHQIVARAMEVRVGRNPDGWEISVTDMELSERGRNVFGTDKLAFHQMHRDIAFALPKGTVLLGSSPVCEIQGFHRPGQILCVQGHPEFNGEIMQALLEKRHDDGIFDDELYKDAAARASIPHDGSFVGKVFARFLLNETSKGPAERSI